MKHRRTLVALLAAAAFALAGCADDEPQGDENFNDADAAFAQGMIPHHQRAIEMSELADGRAQSAEVKELAAAIEGPYGPEIQTLTSWLASWGEQVPEEGMSGMDHDGMSGEDMTGMMTQEDMDALQATSGAEFDQMFLTMMIEHHEGAIAMAQTEQAEGQNPDAIALAEQIGSDQQAEIQAMRNLLES